MKYKSLWIKVYVLKADRKTAESSQTDILLNTVCFSDVNSIKLSALWIIQWIWWDFSSRSCACVSTHVSGFSVSVHCGKYCTYGILYMYIHAPIHFRLYVLNESQRKISVKWLEAAHVCSKEMFISKASTLHQKTNKIWGFVPLLWSSSKWRWRMKLFLSRNGPICGLFVRFVML